MLDNIENRLMYVLLGKLGIIIRNIKTGYIYKNYITKNNKQEIEKELKDCHNDYEYDIIIRSTV